MDAAGAVPHTLMAVPFPPLPPVLIRGGGDLASGVAWRLYRCGFPVLILELPHPLVIRRTVAFANAIFEGEWVVEGVRGVRAREVPALPWGDVIPVVVDAEGSTLRALSPPVIVDARMTKRPADTSRDDAPIVVGLGPGFTAGADCHRVVETQRGHFLGRVYDHGSAIADSGVPGSVGDEAAKRVVRAPRDGAFEAKAALGDRVRRGQEIGRVEGQAVRSALDGILRGLVYDGTRVTAGLKLADVDPRPAEQIDLHTISDKARAVGGGVLEAILTAWRERSGHGG